MSKIVSWLSLSLFGMACLLLNGEPAHALNDRSWVSRTGDNANTCTIAAPCLTFSVALAKTNPEGSINCLDAGEFGGSGFTINKAITIDCTGTFGGVLQSGSFEGITINAPATDVVRLRGLSIEGAGLGTVGVQVS